MFKKKLHIKQFELGHNGILKPSVLLNYMQEVAETHAGLLGVSVEALLPENLTWVLSRYHIIVHRWPVAGERPELYTWPSVHEKLYALRDFRLVDETGEILMTAVTSWMLLDTLRRRPVPLHRLKLNYEFKWGRSMENDFPALESDFNPRLNRSLDVTAGDLDINRHVNHIRYIEWALDSVDSQTALTMVPREMAIAYKRELSFGQKIHIESCPVDSAERMFHHRIVPEEADKPAALLKTIWKPV